MSSRIPQLPCVVLLPILAFAIGSTALGQGAAPRVESDDQPTGSLLIELPPPAPNMSGVIEMHGLRGVSMFALASPETRVFRKHDLIQIVVRETSLARSTHELNTSKDWSLNGGVSAWPDLDLLNFVLQAGGNTSLPEWKIDNKKDFDGDGEYKRKDDFTARLTAEVLDVLPNGNLILEARTEIVTDREQSVLKVTGICRALDVTPANTVLSNQLHDLKIEKIHEGDLKDANTKGIIARVLDTIFAF